MTNVKEQVKQLCLTKSSNGLKLEHHDDNEKLSLFSLNEESNESRFVIDLLLVHVILIKYSSHKGENDLFKNQG